MAGQGERFIYQYIKSDIVSLESLVTDDYDKLFSRFINNIEELVVGIKRNSTSPKSPVSSQQQVDKAVDKKNAINSQKFIEKWRTPLVQRSNYIVKKPVISAVEQKLELPGKKRSAVSADISLVIDEEDLYTNENSDSESVKVKLFKSSKKKKVKKNHSAEVDEETIGKTDTVGKLDSGKNPSKKARLISQNSEETPLTVKKPKKSKKINLEQVVDQDPGVETEILETGTKSTKKKKIVKKKKEKKVKKDSSEVVEDLDATTPGADTEELVVTKTKKLKKHKSSKAKEEASPKRSMLSSKTPNRINSLKSFAKTPGTASNNNRRVSRILLQSAIRKSMNKPRRPLTRRALAEATANAKKLTKVNATSDNVPETGEPKKPMNPTVSALRATAGPSGSPGSPVKKLIGKYENISKKTLEMSAMRQIQLGTDSPRASGRIKTKDPIDQRKQVTAQAKLDAKRKSVKKAHQFFATNMSKRRSTNSAEFKEAVQSNCEQSATKTTDLVTPQTTSPKTKIPSPVSTELKTTPKKSSEKTPVQDKDSSIFINAKSEEDQKIIDNIMKSGECKVSISRIPKSLIPTNNAPVRVSSASASAFLAEQHRRLTKDFTQSSKPQIPVPYNNLAKMTPSKPSSYQLNIVGSVSKPNNGVQKHALGYTPSKVTRTEFDEKRKAELLAKEEKQKERLIEQNRLKKEKQEESKKKREEKLKKIQEVKQKQELEREEKRKEMERQAAASVAPKITSSSSNNSIMHKSGFLHNHSLMNKKVLTDQSNKPIVSNANSNQVGMSKKLSAVDQEAISNFAAQFGKFKQLQQQMKSDDVPSTKEKNLETTYVLKSPPSMVNKPLSNPTLLSLKQPITNYEVTPLQPPKLKDINNYDVSNLGSEDDTDDDEEPSKPIPAWAVQSNLVAKVKAQNHSMVNFTRLFKSASQAEINLEQIFKTRRKKFTERSSSANWNCPPVWNGSGITGEESFRCLKE